MNLILSPTELSHYLQKDRFNEVLNSAYLQNVQNETEYNLNWLYKVFSKTNADTVLLIKEDILYIYFNGMSNHDRASFHKKFLIEYIKLKIGFYVKGDVRIIKQKYFGIK